MKGSLSHRMALDPPPSQTSSATMTFPTSVYASCFIPSTPSILTPTRSPLLHHHRLPVRTPHHSRATSDLVPNPTPNRPLQTSQTHTLHRVLTSIYPFSRPHTIYGTLISILSLTILSPLLTATSFQSAFLTLATSLPPALLTNLFIVGLNQLHDIPLDTINKPYLPLVTGRLTPSEARVIIYTSLALAITFLPFASSPPLSIVVLGSAILGYAYSAPPIRLKRFATLASAAIMAVRGVLVNACFFLHASAGGLIALPGLVKFAVAFFTLFGTVIALLKDVPDIPGDRLYGIRTFSVRVGGNTVFAICTAILVSLFLCGGWVFAGIAWGKILQGGLFGGVSAAIGSVLHLFTAIGLWRRSRRVNVFEHTSVTRFYMHAWKVFYLEYLLLPLAAL